MLGVDDYPWHGAPCDANNPDTNFAYLNCTDFCAWRMRNDLGFPGFSASFNGQHFGNGGQWADEASAIGVQVDGNPVRGSLACFQPGVQGVGSAGHIAVVLSGGSSSMTIEDYNWARCRYLVHTVPTAGVRFIHFADMPQPVACTWTYDAAVQAILDAYSTQLCRTPDTPGFDAWVKWLTVDHCTVSAQGFLDSFCGAGEHCGGCSPAPAPQPSPWPIWTTSTGAPLTSAVAVLGIGALAWWEYGRSPELRRRVHRLNHLLKPSHHNRRASRPDLRG